MITNVKRLMNKKLTTELKNLADSNNIGQYVYWEDGISNLAHVQRCVDLGISVPQSILDYLADDTVDPYYPPPVGTELESVESGILAPKYHALTNQTYYYDKDLDMNLSTQIFESGFGINSGNISPDNWMRRFNGMSLTNTRALAHPYGIVVHQLFCCVDSSATNAFYDCLSYDINGNNGQIHGRLLFNQQGNQMGYATERVKLFIPAFRRVTIRSGGANISYPQGLFKYREVLNVTN